MRYLILCALLWNHFSLQGKNVRDRYDSLHVSIMDFIGEQEFAKAKNLADSICSKGQNLNDEKLIFFCYYLSAKAEYRDSEKRLEYYFSGLEYVEEHPNIPSKYLIYYYLGISQVYNNIDDMQNNLKYLNKAREYSEQNDNYLLTSILNLLSLSFLELKDTANALAIQKELLTRLNGSTSLSWQYVFKFDYYFLKKESDSALFYCDKYIDLYKNVNDSHVSRGLISDMTHKISKLLLRQGDTSKAIYRLEQALENSQKTPMYKLTNAIANDLTDIYLQIGDTKKAALCRNISKSIEDSIPGLSTVKNIAKIEYEEESKFKTLQLIRTYRYYLYACIAIILSLMLIFIICHVQKGSISKIKLSKAETKFQLSDSKLKSIKSKMDLFFDDKLYLQKGCTMKYLVEELEIKNERYLREYISVTYKKGFNDFINELRISYIVNLLQKDELLRNYTMDEIANKAGFASRSNFSRVFKNQMNRSPIQFINSLKD